MSCAFFVCFLIILSTFNREDMVAGLRLLVVIVVGLLLALILSEYHINLRCWYLNPFLLLLQTLELVQHRRHRQIGRNQCN